MFIVLKTVRQLLLVNSELMRDLLVIHYQCERNYSDADYQCSQAMTPNVHALIVHHEQTPEDLLRTVEVYTVPVRDVLVVFHVPRGCVVVPDRGRQRVLCER